MPSIDETAARLARLLTGGGTTLGDTERSNLVFEPVMTLRPLVRAAEASDTWAVDAGQALVADARCLQVVVTRTARVHWRAGHPLEEEQGPLHPYLLGGGQDAETLHELGGPVPAGTSVDINLLREWNEWSTVAKVVGEAEPGSFVLVDGDLCPDWRFARSFLVDLADDAAARHVTVAGVTKHSALARGGAPLLGQLEQEAERTLGNRALWWTAVGATPPDDPPAVTVTAARLDPAAPFAFRVDFFAGTDPQEALGRLSGLADDAGFPGYPYPLTVADRLAACPAWVRDEVWSDLERAFDAAGLPPEVHQRAFADRHRLLDRPP